MARTEAYGELSRLGEDIILVLKGVCALQNTDLPLAIGLMEYGDRQTGINQRIDIPIEYDGQSYYITLRRRNNR